jgi:hypothetical protein
MIELLVGVVVENFSYVYQTTGGAKAVTREEMRAFKKVWAEFANQKTGFLERPQFVPFFKVSATLLAAAIVLLFTLDHAEIRRHLRSPHLSNGVQCAKYFGDLYR